MVVRALDAATGDLIQHYYNDINARDFEFAYMTSDAAGREVVFEVEISGGEPVWLSRVSAHGSPDAIYRTFENGIVLANPGHSPYEFDLSVLTPAAEYRRITGRSLQDPQTNDGTDVDGPVVLKKDALFLEVRKR